MKTNPQTQFVEDILEENNIDIVALSKAKFRHPVRHWLRVKYLVIKDKLEEIGWKLFNIFR